MLADHTPAVVGLVTPVIVLVVILVIRKCGHSGKTITEKMSSQVSYSSGKKAGQKSSSLYTSVPEQTIPLEGTVRGKHLHGN